MAHYHDFQTASPQQSIQAIGRELEQLRLSKNLSQSLVASEAGVSRRTITRMEAGETVSLDTFVRVLKVYDVADRIATLFPEHTVRPIERVKLGGKQRKRASSVKSSPKNSATDNSTKGSVAEPNQEPWSWADEAGESSDGEVDLDG
ncbi:MAG: helix-turn-helix transcriptional regulator [Arenicella sp.]|nr:helix-turn-helix transcriptional regulator [Arenicella sp.]